MGRPLKEKQLAPLYDWQERKRMEQEGVAREGAFAWSTDPGGYTSYTSYNTTGVNYSHEAYTGPTAYTSYEAPAVSTAPPASVADPWTRPRRQATQSNMNERYVAPHSITLIKSSFIEDVRYDVGTMELTVRIRGQDYIYNGITYHTVSQFMLGRAICTTYDPTGQNRWWPDKHPSLGAYYNRHIKYRNAHLALRITPATPPAGRNLMAREVPLREHGFLGASERMVRHVRLIKRTVGSGLAPGLSNPSKLEREMWGYLGRPVPAAGGRGKDGWQLITGAVRKIAHLSRTLKRGISGQAIPIIARAMERESQKVARYTAKKARSSYLKSLEKGARIRFLAAEKAHKAQIRAAKKVRRAYNVQLRKENKLKRSIARKVFKLKVFKLF